MKESLAMCVEADFYFHNLTRSTRAANLLRHWRQKSDVLKDHESLTWEDPSKNPLNPLTIEMKHCLINGMSQNVAVNEKLKFIKIPILQVYSKKNCFVHIKHADMINDSLQTQPRDKQLP